MSDIKYERSMMLTHQKHIKFITDEDEDHHIYDSSSDQ